MKKTGFLYLLDLFGGMEKDSCDLMCGAPLSDRANSDFVYYVDVFFTCGEYGVSFKGS